jgi:hypothetical protein
VLFANGFDRATIGTAQVNGKTVVVYSADICLEIIMEDEGMDDDQAMEFFQYNVLGSYMGDETPIFVWN